MNYVPIISQLWSNFSVAPGSAISRRVIRNFSSTQPDYGFYARTGNTVRVLPSIFPAVRRCACTAGQRRRKKRAIPRGRKNRERVVKKRQRGDATGRGLSGRGKEGEERRRRGERRRGESGPPDTEMAQCPAGYADSAIVLAGLPFPRLYGQRAEFVAVPVYIAMQRAPALLPRRSRPRRH